jgi:hypothetical protein
MAMLLLHNSSGATTVEDGSVAAYARDHGLDMMPSLSDGDNASSCCARAIG